MCAISDLIALMVSICIGLAFPGPALMVFSRALRWAFRVLSVSDQLALFCIGLFITFVLALFWIAHIFGLLLHRQAVELD
jgi:hypothetical protein